MLMVILHLISKVGTCLKVGFLQYVREDIPPMILKATNSNEIEEICVETNLINKKWLLGCSCNPQNITH